MRRIILSVIVSVSILLPAVADDVTSSKPQNREDWLRFSNWEHRTKMSRPGLTSNSKSLPASSQHSGSRHFSNKVPLPDNPGSQTVEQVQPSIPGWAFQQPATEARPPQIFTGGSHLNTGPFQFSADRNYYFRAGYAGSGALPFLSGWRAPNGNSLIPGTPGNFYPYRGSFQSYSRLGPEVIETGPSPASGNYYQPKFNNSQTPGHYYDSSTPWQIPLNSPSMPKDYWGPQGNPFKQ